MGAFVSRAFDRTYIEGLKDRLYVPNRAVFYLPSGPDLSLQLFPVPVVIQIRRSTAVKKGADEGLKHIIISSGNYFTKFVKTIAIYGTQIACFIIGEKVPSKFSKMARSNCGGCAFI